MSNRTHKRASSPWQTCEQQTSFGHTEVEHAQGPSTTNLYPANTEWAMGLR